MELSALLQISPSLSYSESESPRGGTDKKEESLNIKCNILKKVNCKISIILHCKGLVTEQLVFCSYISKTFYKPKGLPPLEIKDMLGYTSCVTHHHDPQSLLCFHAMGLGSVTAEQRHAQRTVFPSHPQPDCHRQPPPFSLPSTHTHRAETWLAVLADQDCNLLLGHRNILIVLIHVHAHICRLLSP